MMKPLYTEHFQKQMEKESQKAIGVMALVTLLTLVGAVVYLLLAPITWLGCVLAGLVTAGTACADYWLLNKRVLPIRKTRQLMTQLQSCGETVTGTFLGYEDALAHQSGVMMRRLILDCGDYIGLVRTTRNIDVPVLVSPLPYQEGEEVTLRVSGGTLTEFQTDSIWEPRVDHSRGAYHISRPVLGLILLCCAIVWSTVWEISSRDKPEETVRVAVCSEAHLDFPAELIPATPGIRKIAFSYMDTTDGELTANYLATYGALDADIIFLEDYMFEQAFGSVGYILSQADRDLLSAAAGTELHFTNDPQGSVTGIVLVDQRELLFPGLTGWLSIPNAEGYVAFINPASLHLDDGAALEVLGLILQALAL